MPDTTIMPPMPTPPDDMAGYPFCGVTPQMVAEARRWGRRELLAWNKRDLTWFIADRLPGISLTDLTAAYAAAFASWQRVCGLTFKQTGSSNGADFVILTRNIDGRNGVLAEHQLPPGNDQQLRGWFDVGETWTITNPPPSGRIDLVAVATHEFGHGIGIDHLQSGLMAPYYNPKIRVPQTPDIAEAVKRYGQPVTPPVAPPTPPTPPPAEGTEPKLYLEVNGKKYTVPMVLQQIQQ